ncbi:MAG TPA: ABC transporter ATP-binding protein, partial [Bacillota bacterium]|nr:ABC transporter ATP-binding protein [Bacillota bacterium]
QLQRRLGITFIYVTHDQEEALVMSDRIAVMNAGRIEQMDSAEDLYERPRTRFVAQFLGSCNLLPGKLIRADGTEATVETPIGPLQIGWAGPPKHCVPGSPMTLAIRPEKIRLAKPGSDRAANQVEACVEDLIYSGAETQYRLRQKECVLNAVALNARSGHQGFGRGETVICELAPQALVVLED